MSQRTKDKDTAPAQAALGLEGCSSTLQQHNITTAPEEPYIFCLCNTRKKDTSFGGIKSHLEENCSSIPSAAVPTAEFSNIYAKIKKPLVCAFDSLQVQWKSLTKGLNNHSTFTDFVNWTVSSLENIPWMPKYKSTEASSTRNGTFWPRKPQCKAAWHKKPTSKNILESHVSWA